MIRPDFLLDLLVSLNLSIRKNHPSPSVTPVIEQIANASQSLLRRNAWLARKLSRAARWGTRAEARMRMDDSRAFPATGFAHSHSRVARARRRKLLRLRAQSLSVYAHACAWLFGGHGLCCGRAEALAHKPEKKAWIRRRQIRRRG